MFTVLFQNGKSDHEKIYEAMEVRLPCYMVPPNIVYVTSCKCYICLFFVQGIGTKEHILINILCRRDVQVCGNAFKMNI